MLNNSMSSITLNSGSGPKMYCFSASESDEISITYTAGGRCYDNEDADVGSVEYVELVFESLLTTAIKSVSEGDITIYPNPAKEVLYIDINNISSSATCDLKLVNINGQTVYQKSIDLATSMTESINTSNLATGVYMVCIVSDEFSKTYKVIIE